jgi:hypothetical protein
MLFLMPTPNVEGTLKVTTIDKINHLHNALNASIALMANAAVKIVGEYINGSHVNHTAAVEARKHFELTSAEIAIDHCVNKLLIKDYGLGPANCDLTMFNFHTVPLCHGFRLKLFA